MQFGFFPPRSSAKNYEEDQTNESLETSRNFAPGANAAGVSKLLDA
jgi:hypothetical protein